MRHPKWFCGFLVLLILVLPSFLRADDPAISRDDFKEFRGEEFVDLSHTIVEINTIGTGVGRWEDWDGEWRQGYGGFKIHGMGVVLKGNIIVTAAHVVHPTVVTVPVAENYSVICKMIYLHSREIQIKELGRAIPARIEYLDIEYDLAVLKYYGNQLKPLDYPMLNNASWFVWQGQTVATITLKRNEEGDVTSWYEVRTGKVILSRPDVEERQLPWFNMADFTVDLKCYFGDSGSPVFTQVAGKLYFIGVIRAKHNWKNSTYVVRLDPIIPHIQRRE